LAVLSFFFGFVFLLAEKRNQIFIVQQVLFSTTPAE